MDIAFLLTQLDGHTENDLYFSARIRQHKLWSAYVYRQYATVIPYFATFRLPDSLSRFSIKMEHRIR